MKEYTITAFGPAAQLVGWAIPKNVKIDNGGFKPLIRDCEEAEPQEPPVFRAVKNEATWVGFKVPLAIKIDRAGKPTGTISNIWLKEEQARPFVRDVRVEEAAEETAPVVGPSIEPTDEEEETEEESGGDKEDEEEDAPAEEPESVQVEVVDKLRLDHLLVRAGFFRNISRARKALWAEEGEDDPDPRELQTARRMVCLGVFVDDEEMTDPGRPFLPGQTLTVRLGEGQGVEVKRVELVKEETNGRAQ